MLPEHIGTLRGKKKLKYLMRNITLYWRHEYATNLKIVISSTAIASDSN